MSNTVSINGDKRKFSLNDNLKLYALIDAGFTKSPKGNYNYAHPLYEDSPYDATALLKMTINKDMSQLTMVITDKSGLKKIDIFKQNNLSGMVELLNYILKDLEERNIISEVKD
ncbi:MAG: hypothetical protein Q3960_01230 [Lactobacillus sp.]|nr:hypothetical protein [Lactobacillus sp.]